jgi:hypothetical protein
MRRRRFEAIRWTMVAVAFMIAPPCISLFVAMTEGGLGLESVASPLFHFADWQEELTSLDKRIPRLLQEFWWRAPATGLI